MLKTNQFKTHCKGDSRSSKTANIILPGLTIKQRWKPLLLQLIYSIQIRVSTNIMQLNLNSISLAHVRTFTFVRRDASICIARISYGNVSVCLAGWAAGCLSEPVLYQND